MLNIQEFMLTYLGAYATCRSPRGDFTPKNSQSQNILRLISQLFTLFPCYFVSILLKFCCVWNLVFKFAHCGTCTFLLPVLRKILNHSLHIVENFHCNSHKVENSNCTCHSMENITKYFPHCGNYQHSLLQNYFTYLTVNVLLSNFTLPQCGKFFIQFTLHFVEHK